jgi:hypothetical protein
VLGGPRDPDFTPGFIERLKRRLFRTVACHRNRKLPIIQWMHRAPMDETVRRAITRESFRVSAEAQSPAALSSSGQPSGGRKKRVVGRGDCPTTIGKRQPTSCRSPTWALSA